jgi:hypothetical protein
MTAREIVVCSFWVHRPKDFPKAAPYANMLQTLDGCCKRLGYRHVVLTDWTTAPHVDALDLTSFGVPLARNLMLAVTEVQARWLESPHSADVDTLFVGADCLITRDLREAVPPGDLVVAYMKGHKKWRLNTGFMYVRAESREKVAKVFRLVAGDCSPVMCDDMAALERALSPMPPDYGAWARRGLCVNFVEMDIWNRVVNSGDDPAANAYVLHFLGEHRKALFFEWAKKHLPKDAAP